MSDWFSSSYMAKRGIARGRAGETHHLTEAKQGSYQYVYGPYASPVLTIKPGDVVVADTLTPLAARSSPSTIGLLRS